MKQKKVLQIISVTIVILIPIFSFCQHEGKARMKGIVTDEPGNPLPDVNVKLFSLRSASGFETKTDKNGVWKAMWIRGGEWNLDFEKRGYEPKKISVTLKEGGKIISIETTLKKIEGLVLKTDLMKEFEQGNRLFDEGKFDEALAVYENILKKFPESYAINLNVGNCYFEKQEYEKAIRAYLKVVEQDPRHIDCLLSIGNSYTNMKQPEKAMEWYKKIDMEKIDDPVVLYNIGIFYFNSANLNEAIPFFKRSVQVKEDFKDGWYQLGMAYMAAENNEAAIAAFETYLKYDGQSEQAQQTREILKAIKQ
jgi:tetratricopeptide (TPR) repeat protein